MIICCLASDGAFRCRAHCVPMSAVSYICFLVCSPCGNSGGSTGSAGRRSHGGSRASIAGGHAERAAGWTLMACRRLCAPEAVRAPVQGHTPRRWWQCPVVRYACRYVSRLGVAAAFFALLITTLNNVESDAGELYCVRMQMRTSLQTPCTVRVVETFDVVDMDVYVYRDSLPSYSLLM